MSDSANFEQPRQWNYLVDDSIPLTWAYRWYRFQFHLPLLLVSIVVLVEAALLSAWVHDRLNARTWAIALSAPFIMFLMVFAIQEFDFWIKHRTRRRLRLTKRNAQFSHSRYPVPWKNIIECCFVPCPAHPELTRFDLIYRVDRKGHAMRAWSLMLSSEDAARLRSCLSVRSHEGAGFAIVDSGTVHSAVTRPPKIRGVWPLAFALVLFMHGFPMLAVLIDKPSHPAQEQNSESKSKFGKFVREHFKSKEQLRAFCCITGATLTGAGIVLYVFALRQIRRDRARGIEPETKKPLGRI